MSGVKLVDFFAYIDDGVAELDYSESEDGAWVAASDYSAQVVFADLLAADVRIVEAERDTLRAANQRLEDEVKRLARRDWIKSCDQLPTQGQQVIVWAGYPMQAEYWKHEPGVHDGDTAFIDTHENELFPVNFWMPMPGDPAALSTNGEVE